MRNAIAQTARRCHDGFPGATNGGRVNATGTPLILADDLSGAAETAAALGGSAHPTLCLWPDLPATPPDGPPLVVDLDSRALSPSEASARVVGVLNRLGGAGPLFKKIDSLLRGNISAETAPLVGPGHVVVFTPALPQQGRTLIDGHLLIDGVPLARTDLWAVEATSPPAAARDVLGSLATTPIGLSVVRGEALAKTLRDTAGTVAVCDAETQADLDALVTAALSLGPVVRFVGSSALARALGGQLPSHAGPPRSGEVRRPPAGTLFVLGSAALSAREQADVLVAATGAAPHRLPADELVGLSPSEVAALASRLAGELAADDVLLQVAPEAGPRIAGEAIVAALAALVRATLSAAPGWPVRLMLTGGQTARAVLDALGQRRLELLAEVHPGAVLLTTDHGWLVAVRPGSHGGPDSLVQIHRALQGNPDPSPTT